MNCRLPRLLTGLAVLLVLGGCGWLNRPPGDPARDPNFLNGKQCLEARAFEAARANFQRAVDVNPGNLLAHYELGLLYYKEIHDPVLAIYHLERFRTLAQQQNHPDREDPMVAEWIRSSRYALASEFRETIGRTQQESQLAVYRSTVSNLTFQVQQLQQQLAQNAQLQLNGQSTTATRQTATPAPSPTPANPGPDRNPAASNPRTAESTPVPTPTPTPTPDTRRPAVHKVVPGETPYSIARRHGVPVTALLQANPGIDPRRLKVGETLRLPPR